MGVLSSTCREPSCSCFKIGSIGEEVDWERKAVLYGVRGDGVTSFRGKVDCVGLADRTLLL